MVSQGWNRYTRLEFWKGLYHILRAVRRGAETFGLLISQVRLDTAGSGGATCADGWVPHTGVHHFYGKSAVSF